MSNQVRRMVNGDVIQIRTGVIQGVGPQGPIGPTGLRGPTGPRGAQGVPGPTGHVDESVLEATGGGTAADGADTIASFSTVVKDEAGIYQSATTMGLTRGGWAGTAFIRFTKRAGVDGSGDRSVAIVLGGDVVAQTTVGAAPDSDSAVSVAFTVAPGTTTNMQVRVNQSDGASLNYISRLWISRIGAGEPGPPGPLGPTGPAGPRGPAGPTGPSGSMSPSTTFADLGATAVSGTTTADQGLPIPLHTSLMRDSYMHVRKLAEHIQKRLVTRYANASALANSGTPIEGQLAWLNDANILQVYTGSAWKQVYPAKPTIYSGSSSPTSSLGVSGDVYIQY